jgi:hypothetical protein
MVGLAADLFERGGRSSHVRRPQLRTAAGGSC